jgi:hypothetical protein
LAFLERTVDIISKPSQNQYVSYRTDAAAAAAAAATGLQLHAPERNKNTQRSKTYERVHF